MSAPKDDKNALGNTGGKSLNDRKLAAEVRSLALGEIKKILEEEKLTEFKKAVILRLAPSILPRLNEHTGEDGEKLVIPIYGGLSIQEHDSDQKGVSAEAENPSG
jgi:hypothetical protein